MMNVNGSVPQKHILTLKAMGKGEWASRENLFIMNQSIIQENETEIFAFPDL